jgi:hypothetical protein
MFKNSHVVTDVSHKIGRVSPANGHHRSASLDLVRFHRLFFLAALVSMSLVARDGASEGASTLEGPHYHYVANRMYVPISANQAREYGLDLTMTAPSITSSA